MKKFAQLLNQLFFTYSHLDKEMLLNHYFANTPDPERGYALAVMANTLKFPTFNRKMIKELIQEKVDLFLFELSYDYIGDMSETIALLWPDPEFEEALPALFELIATFNSLKKNEIKAHLKTILNQSNAIERWALLKLGTGGLRIGVSARFLKNTLAKYGQVDVQDIEQVWHGVQPPYETLFAWLEKKGPLPVVMDTLFFSPVMLSHPLEEKDMAAISPEDFIFEKKYDGIRVQIAVNEHKKMLFTRTGEDISHTFPDLLQSITGNVVLDGELVIKTEQGVGSFNDLQQRLNRKLPSQKLLSQLPAGIILYDILSWENQNFRLLSFVDRRQQLENWVAMHPADNVMLSDLLIRQEGQTLAQLKEQILLEDHPAVEGLMIKRKQSPYLAGRPRGHWYKWKRNPCLIDAVLMYAQRGHGKRSSYYSDYTFGLWKEGTLVPIGKAYFGFTDEELLQLDHWIRNHTTQSFGPVREVKKELVFEVAFDAVNLSSRHKSGAALRFPRINRIRWDKPAGEADELLSLLKLIK